MFGSAAHRAYGRLISDGKIVMVVQCRGVADALRPSNVQKGVFPTGLARYTTSAVGAIRRGGAAPLPCHGHDEGQQRRFCLRTPGRANIVPEYTSDLLIAGVRFRLAGCLSCMSPVIASTTRSSNWRRVRVLLCHKLRRERPFVFAPEHGQRERTATSLTISRRRRVAIEFGTWRSGRSGGASGSVTLGNGKLREENFGNCC